MSVSWTLPELYFNRSLQRPYTGTWAMFTLYRIVKRSVEENVPDRDSVHTRNSVFETISAPQQNINSSSHCIGATFETEQERIRYSVNVALHHPAKKAINGFLCILIVFS